MVRISGAKPEYERKIREILEELPAWYVRAASISKILVTSKPEVRSQIARYQHEYRSIEVAPRVGGLLRKALVHELAHGIDDRPGNPHFFSTRPEFVSAHQRQGNFPIQKYADEALEHFADVVAKAILWPPPKLRIYYPEEANFIYGTVFPKLESEFGGKR